METQSPKPRPSIAQIREAITKNRGGWENATDKEILRLWQMLDPAEKTAYLASVQTAPQVSPAASFVIESVLPVTPEPAPVVASDMGIAPAPIHEGITPVP